MNENDRPISEETPRPNFAAERSEIDSALKQEGAEARSKLSEASNAIKTEAEELGDQAQQLAGEQAEKVKEAAASHLDGFADALRAASDELGKNQSGPAAEIVSSAAAGLEGLTRSLHGQSTSQMIETVRKFGRENPVGFLAGSVLAGLALGRFASVASTGSSTPSTGATGNASNPASTGSGHTSAGLEKSQ